MKPRILSLLPEEDRALVRLWLNATDAAKVCGVSVRQLTYWTDKGIIPTNSIDGRAYEVSGLDKAIAIDRAMAAGLTLEKAARMLDEAPAVEAPDLGVGGVIDDLVAEIEGFRRKLPAYLAVADFRRAAAALEAVDVEAVLGDGAEAASTAVEVAARLNAVAAAVDAAVSDFESRLRTGVVVGEVAGAGTLA